MEVRSEQGLMAGRDLFGMPKSPPAPAPGPPASAAMQSVRMAYTADGTAVYAPVNSSPTTPSYQPQGAAHGASMSAATVVGGNGSSGVGFTPHVITVQAGEDVSSKIMSFSQHGTRAVCVLSANVGAISNVTQPSDCYIRWNCNIRGLCLWPVEANILLFSGRFEILSLSGSFLLVENGGQRSRTGGLSVSLAGPDGRLLGGGVAGLLIAASPVQIVLGSFNSGGKKEPKKHAPSDPTSVPLKVTPTTGMRPNSPPSRGTLSESSGGAGSPPPLHQGMAASNNNQPPFLSSMPWK
ncbi:unnamed protein product [Miscanthus lutarioriparius]|uniref:AT-hook motif nuclear-localized protein n=1 Tax=Miscanthus lutarioriparius TaxID=422564 RepID=A0A811PJA9_9POAL|nr:unnamed protein product [Miscanthus lutarioriparius]